MFSASVDGLIEDWAQEGVLPKYAPMLAALHRAHEAELRRALSAVGVRQGDHVLDLACGDGAYTVWLSALVGAGGRVTGVDTSQEFLDVARTRARVSGCAANTDFVRGSVERLPFAGETFDLVWCAQSFYDLPEPVAALREVGRVLKSGGRVVILENDAFHHVVLPWPPAVELALQQAQLRALSDAGRGESAKHYIGRRLADALERAGFANVRVDSRAVTRGEPLSADEGSYLALYLRDLRRRVDRHLTGDERRLAEEWIDPTSPDYVLSAPNFQVTYLYIVATGQRAR